MKNSSSINKWLKHGMTGLVLGGSALVTTQLTGSAMMSESVFTDSAVSIDALDLAGGSKLKDRLVESQDDDMVLVYAFLNA